MYQNRPHPSKVMSSPSPTLRRADRFGFAASFLCAIHCALLPILIALLPAFGLNVSGWIDLDQAFVIFATLLAGTTLTLGYRRHRAFRAWALLLPALALVWLATFSPLHHHDLTHAVLMTIGGLMLAAAHFVNLRLTHAATAAESA